MTTSTSFAQMANNQSISLSSALRANTPPTKGQTTSRKSLTLSIFLRLLLVMFLTLTVSANVWGAKELVYTLTPAEGSNNSYAGNCDITISGIKWNLTGNSQEQPWRIGGKSLTKVDRAVYSKTAMPYNISKIEITHGTASSITVNSFKLIISDAANDSGTEIPVTFKASATTTIELPAGDYTNKYFKFLYNVTVSGSNNKYLQFTNAEFYAETASAADPYTVTFNAGSGTCDTSSRTESTAGAGVTLPTATICDGWEFAGWKETSAVSTETTTAPTLLSAGSIYKPTKNCTLYAVYQRTEGGGGGNSEESVDFSQQGYTNEQTMSSYTGNDFEIAFNKGTNNNAPKYYSNGTAIRIYGGGYFTISSESTITKIVITFGSSDGSNAITTDGGSYSNGTWTGSANSVKFTIGGTSGNRRIAGITVTTSGGSSTTTYYHSTPDCGPSTHTVTFDANGHGTAPDAKTVASGSKVTAPTPAPTTTGYTFGGWYKEAGCTNQFDFSTSITKDITLYAKWTANTYTVTLDNQGATTEGAASVTATYNAAMPSIASNLPKKTGYTFGGYFTGQNGEGTQYYNQSGGAYNNKKWDQATDATLYAKWTANKYTVKFNGNDNTGGSMNDQSFTYGQAQNLTANAFTRTGYTFKGWNTNKSGSGTSYTDGQEVINLTSTSGGQITLYAQWTELLKYTVTLVPGSGSVTSTTITESSAGKGVELPTPTLDCGEWKFAGWKTTSAVTTETTTKPTLIAAGTYKPTSNITLYAVYQRTEESAGGGSSKKNVVFSDQGYANQQEVSSYDGTNFSVEFNKGNNNNTPKYYTSGSAIRIYGGGYFTISSESTITEIVITFGSSDGSNAISADIGTYQNGNQNGTWTGSANSVIFTIGGTSGNRRIASLTVTTSGSSSTTYYYSYPQCATQATVTLNLDGGSFDSKPDGWEEDGNNYTKTVNSGDQVTLPEPNKTGYDFEGWYNASTKVTSPYTLTGNTTLTAHWTQKVYTVTATSNNNNYGTVSVSGTTITASPKTGYTYANPAYTVTSGTATVTQNGNTFAVTPSTNCTIRINFEAIPSHKVYFNTGGLNEITPVDVTEGSTYNITQTPTGLTNECEYNTFAGWTTSSTTLNNANECPEIITSIMMGTDDITLYAVYSKTETIQGGGSVETKTVTLSTPTNTQGYKPGTKTDSEGNTWSYYAAINNLSGTYEFGLNSNELNYNIGSPIFDGRVSSVSFKARNASSSETRKFLFCSTNITAQPTEGDLAEVSIPKDQQFAETYTADLSQSNVSQFYIYTPKALGITNISVTYTTSGGGSTTTTTYNSNPTCLVPVWEGATIDKTALTVNCGERSSMDGAAKITFSKDKIFDFSNPITIEASEGFLVSTSRTPNENYQQSVSQSPLVGTDYPNTFNDKFVYVRAEAPAQSSADLEGTITIKNSKGETLQTFSVTADVTCTQYTLTLNDRGTKTTAEYYAGASVPKPEDPTGVCTDPIHYVFDGWATSTVAGGSTTYTKVSFPYAMPAKATTLYAVYRYLEGGGNGDYNLVTSALDDWSGDYLIAYSDQIFANGKIGGKDGIGAAGEKVDLSSYITNNTIPAAEGDKYKVSLEAINGGYLLKTQDGQYNYQSSNTNGLEATTNKNTATNYKLSVNFVSFEEINLCLSGNAERAIFRYNTDQQGYFRFYKNGGQQPVYLYKKADGTTLYTTSPACGPMLEITSGKDIYVTSGYGTGRNTVIAQQTVEYRATRLKTQNGSAEGTAPDVKVAANGVTMGGVVTDKVKVVELTQNKELIGDKYTITGTVTVQYTPTANNLQEDVQVQLAVDYNTDAKDNFTVHARSLPAEFVIAAKQGEQWYALNGDMSGNDAEKANGYLQVDDIEDPTKATFAPCNTIYTFDGMVDGGNKEYMRFQGIDGKYLWAASEGNTGIQNYAKNTPTAGTIAYNWQLYTSDNETYQLQNEGNGRKLGLSKDLNFGMYSYVSTLQQDIRILPYEEKCLYNYAPTNLKVSVLKATSVTLTWDAVPGATKYQYSSDLEDWIDAGTEPTVTINGLEGGTNQTYYIRAYHEDAGVNKECIDYAEISFTTADCDDVPTNITYSADLNSITVSWTAAASTATIKLFMDEEGAHMAGSYPSAKSPYTISGGLNPNTTYYIQILAGGTCASPIVPMKTKDVEVEIVEWKPDGIVMDVNTNQQISVSLENEVSYGSNVGAEATELFFSKYYEATANVKLVALYNGTKNIIDLTDYIIKYGKTSWESNYITLKDFGATKGQIQPGEEIILYSMQDGTQDDDIMDCVHEDFPDGNWVRVTNSNNTGKGILSFAGDKTLALFKGKNIIDIIGAVNGSIPNNSKANAKPSWGDANGWICATGLSIADDSEIGISTNRCLLIRNNTVTSGENAVASNINDFVTLCSEWKGAHVPDDVDDNGVAASCENFAYVGTFDYSDYYTKFESMGEEQVFERNTRNQDGTITISIPELSKQSCRNIRIIIKDNNTKVISNQEYKVPIMIMTTQGTDGQAFLALQENLATVEVDGNGTPTGNKTNLTLEQAKEICKTCDVVVRDNATLTKIADDAANDHPQVRNIYVYENSSLIVPNSTNYTINNLSLRRKGDEVASLSAYPGTLKLPETSAIPISLDLRVDANNWHWFTLPYDCNISEVTWVNGTPAQYNVDWFLMTYDGEQRAETQSGGCWKQYNGTTIEAGKGYIVGITGDINNPKYTFELRFPMAKQVLEAETTDKIVDVRAWGVEDNIRPNHKGWNLVGNPYLAYYQRNNITNFEGLRLGQLIGPDPQTGYWEQTGNVPYVVVPVEGGWVSYEQVLASETDLMPFTAYFVQVGNDDTHTSTQDLKISFDHTKLQLSATPMPASIVRRAPSEVNETEEPVIVGVSLTNSKGESDKTSLVIGEQFTDDYEMNGDFFKWFGDYYNYYTKPVLYTIGADQEKRAFNAINEELAMQPIPMGMYAAQNGNYTFALDKRSDLAKVQEVWLYDANTNTHTNLMQSDYDFYTTKTNGGGRFTLSVKLAPKVATSIDNVTADKVWATTHSKQIIVNGLENGMHLWLYDATGKLLYNEPTSNYQHTYSVPQTGTYFVSVMKGNQKQTIKVVVE